VVQIVLWYLDSGCSKHMTGDRSQLINFVQKFLDMVKFGNDHVAKIIGYADYQIGNMTISRVYYVEGLGHNLFSVGQFCDSDLEVAFRQHTCFIPRQGLVRGLPKLKFKKDHLCLACAMGKNTKKTHKPKSEDTNQEKLYLLHMDLCGPMRVESINEKKYILVIVDDYSRFTWSDVSEQTMGQSLLIKRCGIIMKRFIIFHVFRALCYPTNDSENLGKLQPKADIGIFIGYAPTKKALCIYNRHTRQIVETIHVDFDELTAMASEQSSSGPALHDMTPGTISSRLVPTSSPSTSYVPPSRNDWDLLFQPMFDELLNPPPSGVNQAPEAIAPIVEVIPPVNADLTGSPSSTIVEQDAPSTKVAHIGSDLLVGIPIPKINSEQSTIPASPQAVVQTDHPLPHNNSKWTKDHPLNNIIDQLDRPVSTRLQLYKQALFCYYDTFLTSVEPKTYKVALTQSCWIEAMQEELHEFERLEVWELVPRPDKVMVITQSTIQTANGQKIIH
nr:integrase, catalytic region, zinc finger, CCHC-type, peptidase aspartic, catalytic [Tanacetum cinerariifolium]